MSTRRLLLDAGNTRLKWAVVEEGRWQAQGNLPYSELSALTLVLEQQAACYIASVARAQHERQINTLLAPFAITPTWLTAEAQFADVINTYADPAQLGVDRWMGLIAARQRTQRAVLVVSVGTAMTVDALSADGTFLGGVIVPGVALMQQALQHGTARVADVAGSWQAFPRSTADAVQSGMIAALCGAIHQQYAQLAQWAGSHPHCIVTGGNAEHVLPHLDFTVEQVPALVLEGIARVVTEGESK